jgi:hypothetical protein
MSIKVLFSLALPLSLTACSGTSLLQPAADSFTVSTTPSGAAVYVMQENIGETPLSINTRQVFPVTFDDDLVDDYGRITLKYDGCQTQTIMVSGVAFDQGINVRLNCEPTTLQPAATAKAPELSIKQRLQKLQALKDDNLITDIEFEKVRQRILGEL